MFGRKLKKENEQLKKQIESLKESLEVEEIKNKELLDRIENIDPEDFVSIRAESASSLTIVVEVSDSNTDLYVGVSDIPEDLLAKTLLYNFSEEVCFNVLDFINSSESSIDVDETISLYNNERLEIIKKAFGEQGLTNLFDKTQIGKGDPVIDPLNPYLAEKGKV